MVSSLQRENATILARPNRVRASEQDVADEIAGMYASLIQRLSERRHALEFYATWLEGVAAGLDPQPTAERRPPQAAAVRRYAVIARRAHTQVVRLRGPEYPGGLIREAALVRSLIRW